MKKVISLILICVICLSLVACGNKNDKQNTEPTNIDTPNVETTKPTENGVSDATTTDPSEPESIEIPYLMLVRIPDEIMSDQLSLHFTFSDISFINFNASISRVIFNYEDGDTVHAVFGLSLEQIKNDGGKPAKLREDINVQSKYSWIVYEMDVHGVPMYAYVLNSNELNNDAACFEFFGGDLNKLNELAETFILEKYEDPTQQTNETEPTESLEQSSTQS